MSSGGRRGASGNGWRSGFGDGHGTAPVTQRHGRMYKAFPLPPSSPMPNAIPSHALSSSRPPPPTPLRRYGLAHGAAFGLSHGLNQLSVFRPANADKQVRVRVRACRWAGVSGLAGLVGCKGVERAGGGGGWVGVRVGRHTRPIAYRSRAPIICERSINVCLLRTPPPACTHKHTHTLYAIHTHVLHKVYKGTHITLYTRMRYTRCTKTHSRTHTRSHTDNTHSHTHSHSHTHTRPLAHSPPHTHAGQGAVPGGRLHTARQRSAAGHDQRRPGHAAGDEGARGGGGYIHY